MLRLFKKHMMIKLGVRAWRSRGYDPTRALIKYLEANPYPITDQST